MRARGKRGGDAAHLREEAFQRDIAARVEDDGAVGTADGDGCKRRRGARLDDG